MKNEKDTKKGKQSTQPTNPAMKDAMKDAGVTTTPTTPTEPAPSTTALEPAKPQAVAMLDEQTTRLVLMDSVRDPEHYLELHKAHFTPEALEISKAAMVPKGLEVVDMFKTWMKRAADHGPHLFLFYLQDKKVNGGTAVDFIRRYFEPNLAAGMDTRTAQKESPAYRSIIISTFGGMVQPWLKAEIERSKRLAAKAQLERALSAGSDVLSQGKQVTATTPVTTPDGKETKAIPASTQIAHALANPLLPMPDALPQVIRDASQGKDVDPKAFESAVAEVLADVAAKVDEPEVKEGNASGNKAGSKRAPIAQAFAECKQELFNLYVLGIKHPADLYAVIDKLGARLFDTGYTTGSEGVAGRSDWNQIQTISLDKLQKLITESTVPPDATDVTPKAPTAPAAATTEAAPTTPEAAPAA